jgi:putative ATP-dependent endonuclease of OLD family
MFLEKAEILNFRGIRHLSIDFQEDSTALIGENSWGKTSLLRLLWLVLGQGESLCQFKEEDLYIPVALNGELQEQHHESKVLEPVNLFSKSLLDLAPASQTIRELREIHPDFNSQEFLCLDEQSQLEQRRNLEFLLQDVYKDIADKIEIDLWFSESTVSHNFDDEPLLRRYWIYGEDGIYRLHWHILASKVDGKFTTVHELLNIHEECFDNSHGEVDKALLMIISLSPVLRVRDSRMLCATSENKDGEANAESSGFSSLVEKLATDAALSAQEVGQALLTLNTLLSKYLTSYDRPQLINYSQEYSRNAGDIVNRPISIETLSTINETFQKPGLNKVKILLSLLAGAVLSCKGNREISKKARPIVIFEDIESRFHPSLLLSFWSLVEAIDFQKIITTNSGDLLSAMTLYSLRRLHRRCYDTRSFKVAPNSFNHEEVRRIAFHVRINRPMSLFARTWILVEGETEVWVLSTIASLLGISLQCDGIRIIEFAQCGLSPLMKLASQLGIEFHVLTDGDEAGQKYANSVKSRVKASELKRHLTVMPHVDIEHYIYSLGYEEVFKKAAGLPPGALRKGMSSERVIDMAIKRKSKPGLALILVEAMQERGIEWIPPLFLEMIKTVRALSRADEAF